MADNHKVTVLNDRLYVSMTAVTDSYPKTQHRFAAKYSETEPHVEGPQLNLHFDTAFLSMSVADWERVKAAVDSVIPQKVTA